MALQKSHYQDGFIRDSCKDSVSPPPAECEAILRDMTENHFEVAWIFILGSLSIYYGWCIAICYSFFKVVEVGGTGEEKLPYEALGRLMEHEKLVKDAGV